MYVNIINMHTLQACGPADCAGKDSFIDKPKAEDDSLDMASFPSFVEELCVVVEHARTP